MRKPKPRPKPKRLKVLKFPDCKDCVHLGRWQCVRCDIGEFFEPKNSDLTDGDDDGES
jgi:hypothetical protein